MLVVEVIDKSQIKVIHYTGDEDSLDGDPSKKNDSAKVTSLVGAAISSNTYDSLEIMERVVEINLAKDTVELLRYSSNDALYTGVHAVRRAQSRLREREYNLFSNNCETFINWVITNKGESGQADMAKAGLTALGVGVGIAAVGVGVAALFGAFSGPKKRQDDSDSD